MIRLETPADYRAVEELTRESFWNVYRPGCTEHFVLNQYRSNPDFIPELDFVMEEDGRLIGHVMFSKASLQLPDGTSKPSWTFGPICIHPDASRLGIHYHAEPADAEVPYFLAQELIPGWLKANGIAEATYCPPKGYFVADDKPQAFEAYEATFPRKEKDFAPGQLPQFCQSCGMPLTHKEDCGTNADGTVNYDYCQYCYKEGRFLQDCTMDQMIEHCAQFLDEVNKNLPAPMTREQYIQMMQGFFPLLKRWKR